MENDQSPTTSTTTNTVNTSPRTQTPQISIYSSTDRQAVQVIQQALHRQPSTPAQYLQQMYAAQQQHIMLQTAALQQQHLSSSQLQSLAAVQQGSMPAGRQTSSPTGSQQSSVSQTSINLSATPTATQLISRSQTSSTSSSGITQQAMLLGNATPTLTASQAQMYLRAQMLIFTPTATVATVPPDIPATSSSSSAVSASTQVQNLAVRSQQSGALPAPTLQSVPLKGTCQTPQISMGHAKTTVQGASCKASQLDSAPENAKKGESLTSSPEPRGATVTRTQIAASTQQLIAPAPYTPIQPHQLIKQHQIPLHQTTSKAHHQLIIHQQQLQHRHQLQHQLQPLSLQAQTSDSTQSQHCLPIQAHSQPLIQASSQSQHCISIQAHSQPLSQPSAHSHSQSQQQTVVVSPVPSQSPPSPSSTIIIQPHALLQTQSHALVQAPLHVGPNQQQGSAQVQPAQQSHQAHLPPAQQSPVAHIGPIQHASSVMLSQTHTTHLSTHQTSEVISTPVSSSQDCPSTPPAQLQRVPVQSVQALTIQPEILCPTRVLPQTVLASQEQLPAAQALIQMPFQTLPPPQTTAVNLQIQPSAPVDAPLVCPAAETCDQEKREHRGRSFSASGGRPTSPSQSESCLASHHGDMTVTNICQERIGLPAVTSASASVIRSSADHLHMSSCSPLIVPPAKLRAGSTATSSTPPGSDNKPPQAIVKPHILTHVIEGFVIQEGLEPFPVGRSSLLTEQPIKQKNCEDSLVTPTPVQPAVDDQNNAEQKEEDSFESDADDLPEDDGMEGDNPDMLKCEFCGKMDFAHKFRRSKRFCSMSCAKRYNVGCSKRMGLFKSDKSSRWARKPDSHIFSRRGRRPNVVEGASREHFIRQMPVNFTPAEEVTATSNLPLPEETVTAAMTTRRRQNELEREREMRELRMREISESSEMLQSDPTTWTVDHVWEFIHSLPGCQDIADEFRSQEIDGQALLLLKEDHLMSAMNIKLGPALKICARINMLKES
ncbi:polyhomeotic-like protein 3 [Callorhinchus milii]|uniref:polyhomeotic-like protein 3 n=1 Tax=Callorhinchus milii TaxID=7868 RepID=UPI0004573040|nr:polyhomeotic-like protein 3 [Callorhinchus milii]|eukprot:gi/632934173/ref/XP_007902041.1/ PREDICTED: polyhomeotic-like protein 3 [Callorhinchus milii]